jgi:hypothetical protein
MLAAVQSAGLVAFEVRPEQLAKRHLLKNAAAVIYQPKLGRDEFLDDLIALATQHPDVPILLYVRPHPYSGRHITYAAEHGIVRVEMDLNALGEIERLRRTIEFMLRTTLRSECFRVVWSAMPDRPSDIERFVRFSLEKLSGYVPTSPNVEMIAGMIGISVRTVEDHCAKEAVPHPKELLDFVTWLWVAFLADARKVTSDVAARDLGVGRTLPRIRERLAPGESLAAEGPKAEFAAVLRRLTARCEELKRAREEKDRGQDTAPGPTGG